MTSFLVWLFINGVVFLVCLAAVAVILNMLINTILEADDDN